MFDYGNQQSTYKQEGQIPIVQGYAANESPLGESVPIPIQTVDSNFNGQKGEVQPKKFNDFFFAIAFYAHLGVMGYLFMVSLVNGGNGAGDNNGGNYSYSGLIYCVTALSVFAVGVSTFALGFMMKYSKELVKMALFFSIACAFATGILGLMSGNILMGALGLVYFAVSCCYAYFVWNRIPFAAANMNTALTAVRSNLGLGLVAYLVLAITFAWMIMWSVATGGMVYSYGTGVAFLFLVSYYWTHQVLQNTMQVTSAGVIGTWWFVPEEASSFCSTAVMESFTRATTFSFGSICFGSLLVAIVQALRTLHRSLHQNEDFQILVCIVQCILACIEDIIEYLNKWAYVYVGLYGYSYLEAGQNVLKLFENKGWTVVVTDDLCDNVLIMISVAIALMTGLIGHIITALDKNILVDIGIEEQAGMAGFLIGFLVGFVFSSVLMSVVGSAVNTVIVCFAEAPSEFEQNHPMLSMELRQAWRLAWPEQCGNV